MLARPLPSISPMPASPRLLIRLLPLVLLFALSAATARAQRSAPGPQRSTAELVAALKAAHAEVDRALAARAAQQRQVEQAKAASDAAAANVAALKADGRGTDELQIALREALAQGEAYTLSRSALVAAEGRVSSQGARLLRLYDALLLVYRDAVARAPRGDPARARAVAAYRALAAQRDQVRAALRPARSPSAARQERDPIDDVRATDADDVESLLEKADLARDLEERFLRRAAAVRQRILELEQDAQLARDVLGHAQTERLFDESDRLLARSSAPAARFGFPRAGQRTALSGGAQADAEAAPRAPVEEEAAGAADLSAGADGATGAPPPNAPPTDNAAPSAGAAEDPSFDGSADAVEDTSRGGGAPPPAAFTPIEAARASSLSTGALLGSSRDTDLYIAELMAQGRLTLPQLRALEARLKAEAKRMREQNRRLRGTAKARAER